MGFRLASPNDLSPITDHLASKCTGIYVRRQVLNLGITQLLRFRFCSPAAAWYSLIFIYVVFLRSKSAKTQHRRIVKYRFAARPEPDEGKAISPTA